MHEPVSYYCSPNTFLSLIKKRELWLTSLTLSNDKLEGQWMVNRWINSYSQRDLDNRRRARGARQVINMARSHYEALGICFSEEDDLLSQWRGYAADGSGFSVSFDIHELERLTTQHETRPQLVLTKIAYGDQDYERINDVAAILREAFSEDADKFVEEGNGRMHANLEFTKEKHELWRQAVCKLFSVKNGAFSEEKEWRLYAVQPLQEFHNLDYRLSGNLISPYAKIKFPLEAIERVTLGPTNPTPKEVVKAFLDANGVKACLSSSAASYSGRG